MSFEIFASGSVAADPVERADRNGPFVGFTIACDVITDSGKETVWIDVRAQGNLTRRAERLRKGDGVWARGPVTLRRYTAKNGRERQAYQMIANELITSGETFDAC